MGNKILQGADPDFDEGFFKGFNSNNLQIFAQMLHDINKFDI